MGYKFVNFYKSSRIEQIGDTFAGCFTSGFVLFVNTGLAATEFGFFVFLF